MNDAVQYAVALRRGGNPAAAADALRAHLARTPKDAAALRLLALCLCDLGKAAQAIAPAQDAARLAPDVAETHVTLGNARAMTADWEAAKTSYRAALALQHDNANAALGLGTCLTQLQHFDEAEDALRAALQKHPTHLGLRRTLARALEGSGQTEAAIAEHRRTMELAPADARTCASLCFALQASSVASPDAIAQTHRHYGTLVQPKADQLRATLRLPPPKASGPDRPLRIGYLSPDFRDHSVAWFIQPLLAGHDRNAFTPVCFSTTASPDHVTEMLRELCEFHDTPCIAASPEIPSKAEANLARFIASKNIDVLVDLAGHTGGATLGVLALRPAPLQITYLGYPDTTGLTSIDARFVDARTDPPGPHSDALATEQLVRLDPCFLCYRPRPEAPDVASRPTSGPITFGSFNNIKKISPATLDLWARVLGTVPDSTLLLKGRFASPRTEARFRDGLRSRGVAPERVRCLAWTSSTREHLELYSQIDIALDTFPYHGTTTTCEALWQGVPTITLAGDRHASRVGPSLLACAGLSELVARSPDEYVTLAQRVASGREALASMRGTMRERLRQSPLLDERAFCTRFESTVRQLWRQACAR